MALRRAAAPVRLEERGPLRTMFCITSMPVGGAETLLVNLIRRLDRAQVSPELCCLKDLGPLGEVLAAEIPVFHGLTTGKYDVRVFRRLTQLFRSRRIDAIVTVGAGDKMFWGRLAAWRAGVPVIISALHSTGWPDGIGRLNRRLTRITDAFVGVAPSHGKHLIEREDFPAHKVHVIPNGVDTERFRPSVESGGLRAALDVSEASPVIGIVAALRPEKNHELLLRAAHEVLRVRPDLRVVIVGDGPQRATLEALAAELGIQNAIRFVGTRSDIPELVGIFDIFVLTSHMEANPVSILEAMAAGKPIIAPAVGSIPDTVCDGRTGFLFPAGDASQLTQRILTLLDDPQRGCEMGQLGRSRVVQHWSLETMVRGYEGLITGIYRTKSNSEKAPSTRHAAMSPPSTVDHANI